MRGRNGRLQVWRKRVAESGFRHGYGVHATPRELLGEQALRKTLATTALIGAAASIPASKFKGITAASAPASCRGSVAPHGAGEATRGTDPTGHPRTCRPRSWPTPWPGASAEGDSTRRRSSGSERYPLHVRSRVRRRLRCTRGKCSRPRPPEWEWPRERASIWPVMGRRCRCCGSRNLRGACPAPRSRGSSRVTCCSAWLWNWDVGALRGFSPSGRELRDLPRTAWPTIARSYVRTVAGSGSGRAPAYLLKEGGDDGGPLRRDRVRVDIVEGG